MLSFFQFKICEDFINIVIYLFLFSNSVFINISYKRKTCQSSKFQSSAFIILYISRLDYSLELFLTARVSLKYLRVIRFSLRQNSLMSLVLGLSSLPML